jgi:NADPH:quinone reductase-like Zn-dependent oxidoreductase
MRAVVCRRGGDTAYSEASFEYAAQWPAPSLGDMHAAFAGLPCAADRTVLLRVYYSSMNPADRGADGHRTPKVMGSDVAGMVVAAGPGCTRLRVGDEVFGDIGANARLAATPAAGS